MHQRRSRQRSIDAHALVHTHGRAHLHFAREARHAKQGHMGSTRTSADRGREDGFRARWELESGLLEGLAEEAPTSFLLPKMMVGLRCLCMASTGVIGVGVMRWRSVTFN